ncbi:MAG: hypothetical protein K2U26_16775 [Cyclobacteriaceae bacterium]|nr:hypothetical protein [Cyclobacteriaceae bacterium]
MQTFVDSLFHGFFQFSTTFAAVKRIARAGFYSIFLLVVGALGAQPIVDPFSEGLALEKEFEVEAALEQFELVLKSNPDHTAALTKASRMLSNIGGKLPKTELTRKHELLKQARDYAQKSISIDPNDAESRLAHIISLGLLSEIASNPKEKVIDARLIHNEAKKILEIDPAFAEAYFVLGKWQYELSRLNWLELMACKLFFGGFPEPISLEASLAYFDKAATIKPNSILFLYGQASALHELGKNQVAIDTLNRALSLPLAEPDDALRRERCSTLLREILQ